MNFRLYENVLEEPLFSEWPCRMWSSSNAGLQMLRRVARSRLVKAARMYSERLSTLAISQAGIGIASGPILDGDPDSVPVVMTGHQPVIFHSGLTYKYQRTQHFVRQQKAIGIAVVIDTDEGDAGEFPCPAYEPDSSSDHLDEELVSRMQRLKTQNFSFAAEPGLFATNKCRPKSEVQQLSAVVLKNLRECRCHRAAEAFAHVADLYSGLRTTSMSETNLIARRVAGIGAQLMEVRLSEICRLPECLQFFASLLGQPFSWARRCNQVLARYRELNRIRNQANPFPDLRVDDRECELPFWIVNLQKGTRAIPFVRRVDGIPALCGPDGLSIDLIPGHEAAALFSLSIAETPLIPRGPLITATMRLLFSDLFVHGTGGGHYDRLTDELIEAWWNESPSPIAVASASRYLFEEERVELHRLEQLAGRQRDLQFNPQSFIGSGVFPPALEDVLRGLVSEKEGLVKSLERARSEGQSAKEIGRAIQRVSDQIRRLVASEFEPRIALFQQMSPNAIDTIRNRRWPWFFFPDSGRHETSGPP